MSEVARRTATLQYTIKDLKGQAFSVCKKFFLSTFSLKEWTVSNWASNSYSGIHASKDVINTSRREVRARKFQEVNSAKQYPIEILDSLRKLSSRYYR